MEVCFLELKEKEIINVWDGKKLGRIIDILFDTSTGQVKGIVVPGDKKLFRKNEDIFVPLDRLKKIGDDVILVSLQTSSRPSFVNGQQNRASGNVAANNGYEMANQYKSKPLKFVDGDNPYSSYVRYRPVVSKKYR